MSHYPRAEVVRFTRAFLPDRIFAVIYLVWKLISCLFFLYTYFLHWSHYGSGLTIWQYTPPLGGHFSSGITSMLMEFFFFAALWNGRGWGFFYAGIWGVSNSLLALFRFATPLNLAYLFFDLIFATYCTLRLFKAFGPPTGGLELRRTEYLPLPGGPDRPGDERDLERQA